jgi:hypothetical protein
LIGSGSKLVSNKGHDLQLVNLILFSFSLVAYFYFWLSPTLGGQSKEGKVAEITEAMFEN